MLGDGRYHLVAMSDEPAGREPVDVFALGDALLRARLVPRPPGPPDSLHSTVSNTTRA